MPSNFQPIGAFSSIGASLGPSIIFTYGPGGTVTTTPTGVGPYDGIEDTYVGVVNQAGSGVTVASLSLTGNDIFGFDFDGIQTYGSPPSGVPGGSTTGYEGPGTSFSFSIFDPNNGTVFFDDGSGGGLPPGFQTYFSLEGAPDTIDVKPAQTSPTVTAPANQNSNEGAPHAFNLGSFSDPDGGPWSVDVNWGDGSPHTTFTATTAGALGTQNHTYGEENASYNVTVAVTDSTNQSDSKGFAVAVSDPAVVASGVAATTVLRGAGISQSVATFTDPGGAEPNTADPTGTHYDVNTASVSGIDWGDGSGLDTTTGSISFSGSPGSTTDKFTVSGSHTYAASGDYTVTTYINHEGQISTATSVIHIVPVMIGPGCCDNNALLIGGTPGADVIDVEPVGKQTGAATDKVEVWINGVDSGTWTNFGKIVAYGYAGADNIQIAGAIKHDTCLHGGDGNDRLKGGGGNNLLMGDAGDDLLLGDNSGGRSVMIGGMGSDRLVGNAGDDILIGGTIADQDEALCAVLAEWTSSDDYTTRVAKLTSSGGLLSSAQVHDDGSSNTLTGAAGNDLFFLGALDKATDKSASETAIRVV